MPDEPNQAQWQPNQDGSVTYNDGKSTIKYVKESDLLAVKGGAERKESEYLTTISESNRLKDESHTNYLKAQAAFEQSEAKVKEYEPFKAQHEEATKKLLAAESSSKQLREKLLGRVQSSLKDMGVKDEFFTNKTYDELEKAEETAKALGAKAAGGKPANFDGLRSGGGGGQPVSETPLERAKRAIADFEEKRGKPVGIKGG